MTQIPMFRESCPLLNAWQNKRRWECRRCAKGFWQDLQPYLGVCSDCWREWVATCHHTENRTRWETFMKGAKHARKALETS